MADIFISYSQKDPEPTKALAADLEARGYTVWWDSHIRAGERFSTRILHELEAAKAVIVIWTTNSVASEEVENEARLAKERGKLITAHVYGFDLDRIPLSFRGRQSILITDHTRLFAALQMLGVGAHSTFVYTPPANYTPTEAPDALIQRARNCIQRKQYDEALRLFRQAADTGSALAIYKLGAVYLHGRIVARDDAAAFGLFQQAADLGHADAMYAIGMMYLQGRAVAASKEHARHWLQMAAEHGNNDANYALKWLKHPVSWPFLLFPSLLR